MQCELGRLVVSRPTFAVASAESGHAVLAVDQCAVAGRLGPVSPYLKAKIRMTKRNNNNDQPTTSRHFTRTSCGPYTAATTLVLPCSKYALPSGWLNTPILHLILRSSSGLRPSVRSPCLLNKSIAYEFCAAMGKASKRPRASS